MPIVSREELEQLLLSLVLDLYDEEDISEINLIYSEYQKKNYIFPLSKTELYFKTFITIYRRFFHNGELSLSGSGGSSDRISRCTGTVFLDQETKRGN